MKEKYTELDYPILIGRALAVEAYLNTQEYINREVVAAMLGVELKDKNKKEDKENEAGIA